MAKPALLLALVTASSQIALVSAGCTFEDVAAFRDADVISSFNSSLMTGFWYEQAYKDIAQVGASCQTLNATYHADTGILDTDFAVKYGPVPFTIVEHYEQHDAAHETMKGVFRKSVSAPGHIPGGSLVGLPTSVVTAQLSADKSRYESVILYSCVAVVSEIVIATRSPTLADADYQVMLETLKKRGVPSSGLKRVDRTGCPKPVSSEAPLVV